MTTNVGLALIRFLSNSIEQAPQIFDQEGGVRMYPTYPVISFYTTPKERPNKL